MRFRPITTRLFNISNWRQSVASASMRRRLSSLRRSSQVGDWEDLQSRDASPGLTLLTLYNVLKVGRQSPTSRGEISKEERNCLTWLKMMTLQAAIEGDTGGRWPQARYIINDNARRKVQPGVRRNRLGTSSV